VISLLRQEQSCPVCKSSIDQAREASAMIDNSGGREYLAPLGRHSGITFDQLLSELRLYRCTFCRAFFFNPWLNLRARSEVFTTGHPIHNVGWRNYQERLEQHLNPSLQVDVSTLLGTIFKYSGSLSTYLEMGCPFQGLLLHLADDDLLHSAQPGMISYNSMRSTEYQRFLRPLRIFMRIGTIGATAAKLTTRLRRSRNKLRGRWYQATLSTPVPNLKKYFIPLQSSKFWGNNCSMYGNSCTAVASHSLQAELLTYQHFIDSEQEFSAVGLFNVLDHLDEPIDVLRKSLRRSRVVLCLSHDAPFSPQHHIGLGREFFLGLERILTNCRVEELSAGSSSTVLFAISSTGDSD
jgi:hypothetical protein